MKVQDPISWGAFMQNSRRRTAFVAALVEDDTECIDNSSPDECAEEATTQEDVKRTAARRRRRLRILWQEAAEVHESVTYLPTQIEPDSDEERFARVPQSVRRPRQRWALDVREVRAVTQVFRQLVGRVGPVDPQGDVPRAIKHQHWSAVCVLLMWAAACGDRAT